MVLFPSTLYTKHKTVTRRHFEMKKLTPTDINDQQLVDIRSQLAYQSGHLDYSLNLNPKNFKKYAHHFLSKNEPILLIGEDEREIEDVYALAKDMGFHKLDGYINISDVPSDKVQASKTASAESFLKQTDDFILLDVRNPKEITRPAPKKNLVNIALEDLPNAYPKLDSNKTIYTLCGSGNRGTSAASYLETKGFNTTVIEGGMKAIQEIM